ncbi:FmdB family zinc ribbon protein [Arsenicicoccus dermatophilus]|uniref:FmdB family zinc ribbon protein n=1 Tax=Arsenicicoccus dermatophilus TaxID=1076331 RepID=UPI001F4CFB1C|nr:FmdB family transcriptional regulator [Arsenicicoccus dermatophilus]
MPTYSYRCSDCGEAFDIVQSFSDDALTECPACQGRLRKLFTSVGVVFKGSGFYRTDSRGSAASTPPASDKAAPTSSGTAAPAASSTSSASTTSAD